MSDEKNTAFELARMIERKGPEYLDLLTAETDADFEKAFDVLLEKAVSGLEKNKKHFASLSEEALSAVLALALSDIGISVTQEANSNGHVDLTITADKCVPARTKLGEAKIYDGPEYHLKGLTQLLGRYTTGREGRGLLITYFQKQNISGLVKKIRKKMDQELPMKQDGKTTDHLLKWSFLSKHNHSCGEKLEVGHVGCNLYVDVADEAES
jgi:hypothetical protein